MQAQYHININLLQGSISTSVVIHVAASAPIAQLDRAAAS